MPFNAAKQENRTERKVRYALQRKTKSKHWSAFLRNEFQDL
jgi:hypothetical protein